MTQHLVIVESPAKAKTLNKYLGQDYKVLASYGHVRDLIAKDGAVEPDNGYAMHYAVGEKNEKYVKAIADAVKKADDLYLATDPDREGEAISWHLYEILNARKLLEGKPVYRVAFHEITKRAILEAMQNPSEIAVDLVNAQQARRALDHLVGFNLSPLLWRKIAPGLSAGRVQSPALRLICEREDAIEKFIAREYWSVEADCLKNSAGFSAKLVRYNGDKVEQFSVTNGESAAAVQAALNAAAQGQLRVDTVQKKQRRRHPAPPFTTSTLQQEANRKLGFSASRTMRAAQQLYEGVDIGGETVGLITYMRTDSVTLSNDAVAEIRSYISQRYPKALPDAPRAYKTKSKNAQEAHEAVRPTSALREPAQLRARLTPDQQKLYELIWKRAVACQMAAAVYDTVSAELAPGDAGTPDAGHRFRATGSVLVEPGFIAVYLEGRDDVADNNRDDDDDKRLPPLAEGDAIALQDIRIDQHFTEPPPRFTEASLVKTLEEFGIGRPSTYASIISTLTYREYVTLDQRRFQPTDMGRLVNRFLTEHFSHYVDYEFTAKLEDELDAVSRGEKDWIPLMDEFWRPFSKQVEEKKDISREEVNQARVVGDDPDSGKPVSVRMGRFGPFAQIGTKDDEEKPRFASLRKGQSIETITLDEALFLFQLPRDLGETAEGEKLLANVGRFGPYVKYGSKFASTKDEDPYTITRERALEIVKAKKEFEANRIIQVFEEAGIQVLNGRFGPYVTDGNKNGKIPKDREPKSLTLAECEAIIAAAPERKGRGRKGAAKKTADKPARKVAAKKSAAKKSAAKKPKATKAAGKKAAPRKAGGKPPAKARAASAVDDAPF